MMLYKQEAADEKLRKYGITPENGYVDYLPPKVFPYTPLTVLKDKGIQAQNFNEVLALVGDKADNIKGVRGVSEEVGLKLIAEYHTIEELYEEIEHANFNKSAKQLKEYWKESLGIKRSPFNALCDNEADARESLILATIKTDIDLGDFNIYDLELSEQSLQYKKEYKANGFDFFRNNLYAKIKTLFKDMHA